MPDAIAIDANIIVRYLTGDDKSQSPAATELFRAAQAGKLSLIVPTSVIQETVYLLETAYNLDAAAIAPKLISLLAIPNVATPDSRWLVEALQFYRTKNADFGDAMLCAYARFEGCGVATFDKGILKRFPEIATYTPTEWLAKNPQSGKGHTN
jgi:predicted nucleic-acid-binding protein